MVVTIDRTITSFEAGDWVLYRPNATKYARYRAVVLSFTGKRYVISIRDAGFTVEKHVNPSSITKYVGPRK